MQNFIYYLLLVNVITFLLYGFDKRQSIKGAHRISEKSLHLWMLAGGTMGAMAGQNLFRHKTVKGRFRLVFWGLLILQIVLIGCILKQSFF